MSQDQESFFVGSALDADADDNASVDFVDDSDERHVALFARLSGFTETVESQSDARTDFNESVDVHATIQDAVQNDMPANDQQAGRALTLIDLPDNGHAMIPENEASVQEKRIANYDAAIEGIVTPFEAVAPAVSAPAPDATTMSDLPEETSQELSTGTVVRAATGIDVPRQLIEGDETSEFLLGTFADEEIRGNGSVDTILNAGGNSVLSGGDGSDLIVSISGSNVISGGDDFDFLIGGFQDDILQGNGGDDLLRGDISTYLAGRDILIGGEGDDILEGGGGADLFVFSTDDGNDAIVGFFFDFENSDNSRLTAPDFVVGVDQILLTDFGYASSVEALGNFSDVDGFATFSDQGTQFTIFGVSTAELSADDIVLVTSQTNDSGDEDAAIAGNLTDLGTGSAGHFCLVIDAENGTVSVNADGSYTYTPFADFNGVDRFTYSVRDGSGTISYETVELTINPLNDAPRDLTDTLNTGGDTPLTGVLSAIDVDGDDLTFSLVDAAETGTIVVNGDASFVYTPASGYLGQDSFSYSVSDGNGGTTIETVTVNVNVTVDEDDTVSGDLATSYPDATTLVFTLTTDPENGDISVSADGMFTYTPTNDFNGPDSFSYTVSIDGGAPEIVTVPIAIAPMNDVPVIAPITQAELTETTGNEDITGSLTATFTDIDIGDVGHTATVAAIDTTGDLAGIAFDFDALAALVTVGDVIKNADETEGTVDLSFNAESMLFDYLGEGDQITITYQLSIDDGDGGIATQDVDLMITGTFDPLAPFDLAEVAQAGNQTGFVINGAASNSESGRSVSSAGDVNGDGFDDVVIGATNGQIAGGAYVVFGQADGAPVELSDVINGIGGFVIDGDEFTGTSFPSVGNAGDVNGDGLDDVIVGLRDGDAAGFRSGESYVVFGKTDGTVVDLGDIAAGSGGFVINGSTVLEQVGKVVSGAGDVNGDGLADLFVASDEVRQPGTSILNDEGAGYVIFGKADGVAVEISDIEAGIGGFSIEAANDGDRLGTSIGNAGDVNGDGFDDLIIGARFADPNGSASGTSYVVFGKEDGTLVDLSDVEGGTGGFAINGVSAFDNSGLSVSNAGDVNGDGLNDVIVGAPGTDFDDTLSGSSTGSSYVVFGKADGTTVELSDVVDGIGGFAFEGAVGRDEVGRSVSGAGDVNGDGLADLIVGARGIGFQPGQTFVIFGKTNGDAVLETDLLAGIGGFVITAAERGDELGVSVSSAGDVNGDGFDDLIVGAREGDPNGNDTLNQSGTSFVIFGGDFTGAVTQIGSAGNDAIVGQDTAEVLFGAAGDDTIAGNGGGDRLSGGAGNDTFVFTDTGSLETIVDFEDGLGGQDIIDVSAFGFATASEILDLAQANGPGGRDVLIQLDPDNAILLQNFDLGQLDSTDFLI